MPPRMTAFAILGGLHLIGLISRPVAVMLGYSTGSLGALGQLFFVFYLATVVVLQPLYTIGLPVFAKYETWPEPNFLGYVLATAVWLAAYLAVINLVAFAVAAIRRGRAA